MAHKTMNSKKLLIIVMVAFIIIILGILLWQYRSRLSSSAADLTFSSPINLPYVLLYPNEDKSSQWVTYPQVPPGKHYTNVDDPTWAPNNNDYIIGSSTCASEQFGFTNKVVAGKPALMKVYLRAKCDQNHSACRLSLTSFGTSKGPMQKYLDITSNTWKPYYSVDFTGPYTQADVNNFMLKLSNTDSTNPVYVSQIYTLVYYQKTTPTPTPSIITSPKPPTATPTVTTSPSNKVSLYMSPSVGTYSIGQEFDAAIKVNPTNHGVTGVDVVSLNYPVDSLDVVSITPGQYYYKILPVNPPVANNGKITFSALYNTYPSGWGFTVATVKFKVKSQVLPSPSASKQVQVTFNFTPGSTTDCNVVLAGFTGQDKLEQVVNGVYTITR